MPCKKKPWLVHVFPLNLTAKLANWKNYTFSWSKPLPSWVINLTLEYRIVPGGQFILCGNMPKSKHNVVVSMPALTYDFRVNASLKYSPTSDTTHVVLRQTRITPEKATG